MNDESIWIHYARPRPHWYGLDAAEKETRIAAWAEVGAGSVAAGAERIGQYHIRGQHDFQTVELWRFPSAEAAFDHWTRLTAAHYHEWFAFTNNVGLPLE